MAWFSNLDFIIQVLLIIVPAVTIYNIVEIIIKRKK